MICTPKVREKNLTFSVQFISGIQTSQYRKNENKEDNIFRIFKELRVKISR